MVDIRVDLPGSEKDQPKFMYSSQVDAPGALKVAAKKSNFASVVDGVAALGDGIIKATDAIIKSQINDEVTGAVDQVREEYAVNGDLYGGRDITNNPQTTPEIEKQLKYAKEIHQGYMAGTIKDSNYWARLDSISRQLRTRYPGHREYIDDKLSSMVGGTPANRLREQLAEEARALARNSGEQSPLEKIQWSSIKDGQEKGINDQIDPNWQQKIQDGTLDVQDFVSKIGAFNYLRTQTQVKHDQIANAKEETELNKTVAVETAQQEVTIGVNSLFLRAASAGGVGYNEMFKEIHKMEQEGRLPKDGPALEGMLAKVNAMKMAVKAGVSQIIDGEWANHPGQKYSNYMDQTTRDKITNDALFRVQILEDALTGKGTGLIDRLESSINYTTKGDTKRLLESDNNFRMMAAAEGVVGKEGLAILFQHNPTFAGSVAETLSDAILGDLVTGRSDSVVRTIRSVRDRTGAGSKELTQSVGYLKARLLEYLQSDSANPEGFRNIATALFNDKENLLTMLSPQDAALVLGQLTTPAMTKRMQEMTTYDPQIKKQYDKWATSGFLWINQAAIQTVKDTKVNRKYIDIEFDPKTLQFRTVTRGSLNPSDYNPADPLAQVQNAGEMIFNQQSRQAIADLNLAIKNFEPYAKASGVEMGELLERAMAINGVDMKAPYEGPAVPNLLELGQMLGNAVRRVFTDDKKTSEDAPQDNTFPMP